MFRLALAQLRRRPLRYVSLFLSIVIAVALTVATVAISQSLRDSVRSLYSAPYDSVDVVATLHNATPEEVHRLQSTAEQFGASQVALDQQVIGTKKSGSAQLYQPVRVEAMSSGALMWQHIVEGRAPQAPGEIVTTTAENSAGDPAREETRAGIGETIMLSLPTRGSDADIPVKVVGHVDAGVTERLIGTESVYAYPSDVAAWAGQGPKVNGELRVDTPEGVDPAGVAKRLQQSSGTSTKVQTANAHAQALADQYFGKRDHYFVLLDAFVAVVAVVAGLVIFSTYQVLAAQRRREFALVRSIGARTGQLVGSVVIEAALLAALAGILAVPLGHWLASIAGRNASAVGVRVPLSDATLSPGTTFAVALAGVILAVAAAIPAAWMAARRPVVDSLATAESGEASKAGMILSVLAGLVVLLGGLWLGQRMLGASADGAVSAKRVMLAVTAGGLIVLGAMLLLAVFWPLLMGLLGRFVPIPTLQLALSYPGKQRLRSGALVAIVFAGSALVGAVVSGQDKVAGRLEQKAASQALADVAVSSVSGPMPAGLANELRHTAGVVAVAEPQTVKLDAVESRARSKAGASGSLSGGETAYTLDADQAAQVLRDATQGAKPGEVVLGRYSPWRENVKTGDVLRLTIAGQPVEAKARLSESQFTLIDRGIAEQARQAAKDAKIREAGLDPANTEAVKMLEQRTGKTVPDFPVTLVLAKLGALSSTGEASSSGAETGDAPKQEAIVKRIRNDMDNHKERLVLKDGVAYRKAGAESVERVLTVSKLMIWVSVLITLLGVLNVTLLTITERRRDRELLRSIGLGPVRNRLTLALEVLLLVLLAAVLGWLLGSSVGLGIAGVVLA